MSVLGWVLVVLAGLVFIGYKVIQTILKDIG